MVVTLPHAGVSRHSGNGRCRGTRVMVPFQDELPCFLMRVFPPCFTQSGFSKAHSHGRCLGGFTNTGQTSGSLPASIIVASEPVTERVLELGRRWELQMSPSCSRKGGRSRWLRWRWSAGGSGGGGQLAAFTCAATQDYVFGDSRRPESCLVFVC